MSRIRPGRMLVTIFVIGFAIFFGLDLAARGTARISGTDLGADQAAAVAVPPDSRPVKAGAAGDGAVTGGGRPSGKQAGIPPGAASDRQSSARSDSQRGSKQAGATAAGTAVAAGAVGAKAQAGQTSAASVNGSAQSQAVSESPAIVKESFMNHLSNRVGDALHRGAKALMGVIVSAFDAVIS